MRVLVACEQSGIVRDAFNASGHDAWSCDIQDAPGAHICADVLTVLHKDWDMLIAHPPCTFLCNSGLHWNDRGRGWANTERAIEFVLALMNADIPHICIENPVGIISRYRKPSQMIQPYQFGHDASKATHLWLKNLPWLLPTKFIMPRMVRGLPRWSNQTDSGQNKIGPSNDRWLQRSLTYPGIAKAMSEQWGVKKPLVQKSMFAPMARF